MLRIVPMSSQKHLKNLVERIKKYSIIAMKTSVNTHTWSDYEGV